MLENKLNGGLLIVPDKDTAYYLTDRIGNYEELEKYIQLWRTFPIKGYLAILCWKCDGLDSKVPSIGKGKDGNA